MSDEEKICIDWGDLEARGAKRPMPDQTPVQEPEMPSIPAGGDLDLPPLMKANRRVVGMKCSICNGGIELGQDVRNCEECKLSYHLECWMENHGCATYGCPNGPGAKEQLGAPTIQLTASDLDSPVPPPLPSHAAAPVAQPAYAGYAMAIAYAGFWRRVAAALVDGLVLALPFGLVAVLLAGVMVGDGVASIFIGICGWLYYAGMESSRLRATLGKKAVRIVVTDLQGNRISFARASGRYWCKVISALILYIGFLMAGFTRRKQALHDIAAGCLVVVEHPKQGL